MGTAGSPSSSAVGVLPAALPKACFTAETNCVISGCLILVVKPPCVRLLARPPGNLVVAVAKYPCRVSMGAGWGLSESLAHRMSLRGYGSCWTPPARADLRSRGSLAHSFQSHSGRVALGGLPAGSATSGGFQEDRGAREPTLDDQALSHLGEPETQWSPCCTKLMALSPLTIVAYPAVSSPCQSHAT